MTPTGRAFPALLCLFALLPPVPVHAGGKTDSFDLAEKAEDVLRRHCAECHTGPKAKGGVTVLDAAALLRGGRVVKRDPEASELWQLVACGTMPPGDRPRPSAAEVAILREWIDGGAPNFPPRFGDAYVLRQVLKDVRAHEAKQRLTLRYVSFNHLLADAEAIDPEVCKAALASALNHLSMMREPVRPVAIDPTRTIFRINLKQLGWEANPFKDNADVNLYDLILLEYPFATLPRDSAVFDALETEYLGVGKFVLPIPYVRGDWLVTLATQPPLYENLLDLPRTLTDVKDADGEVVSQGLELWLKAKRGAVRGGLTESQGKPALRLLERRDAGPGPYWRTYELTGKGAEDLVRQANTTRAPAQVLFGLPNGLYGFFLADARGQRLETAPAGWITDPKAPDAEYRNGLSCIRCHTEGVRPFKDVARSAIEKSMVKDKDDLLNLFVGQEKLDGLRKPDADRYTDALKAIHGGKVPAVEPLGIVSERYRKQLARPAERSIDRRDSRLRDPFPLQPQLLDRLGKPRARGQAAGDVAIVPWDGLTLPQHAPADAGVKVELLFWDRKTNKAVTKVSKGDELVIKVKNQGDDPIYIELIGISLDSGLCLPLIPAGTVVAPGKEVRYPGTEDFLAVDEKPGKDLYVLYASRTSFPGGKRLESKTGRLGDRFVHSFYSKDDNGKRAAPVGLIKKTFELETVAPDAKDK